VFVFAPLYNLPIKHYFFNSEYFLNLISEKQKSIKAAVMIEGPDGVLNSKDENNPIITDKSPPTIDRTTIC